MNPTKAPSPHGLVDGKVVLVTGAAGGMGAATAELLASLGATVIGADVADAGHERFQLLGAPHRYVRLDVTDPAAWETTLRDVDRLDIAFLNAGVMTRPPHVPILDDPVGWLTPENFRRVMAVNVGGVAYGLAATIPLLERGGGGDILITSSGAGIQPYEPDPVYAASKYSLVGLARSLTPWMTRRGIRINVICPHSVLTGMIPKDLRELPDKTFSPPSYIAESVLDILRSGETGRVWVARGVGEQVWPIAYEDVTPRMSYLEELAPN